MKPFISHISAAIYWKIPYLHTVLGYQNPEELVEAVDKTQMTFADRDERSQACLCEAHVLSKPLPRGAIITQDETRIAAPELVFLQLAQQLGFHRAVLLGLQLCSTLLDGSKPITTADRICSFLERTSGHRGHQLASQAARYITDNSASIMESLLYMLITLPNKWGGCGLSGATLNHEIALSGSDTALLGNKVIADMYFEEAKLVVEYDSATHHANVGNWAKDTQRLTAIESMGYKTLSITTAQLYNEKAFKDSALVIAAHLRQRIRIRTTCFKEQHSLIRSLLPRRS
jgi:hypothetical protein